MSKVTKALQHTLIIWVVFAISSCALVVAPTGGPKDTKPPVAISYLPDSAAVNFNAKVIKIQFNEFIQLKDLQSQLVVSPPMQHPADIRAKLKFLNITIRDTLKPNTTYAFNFGSALADLNEGNALDGFKYVFSTGPYLDSLVLTGTVADAFNQTTQKGVYVMLYDTYTDSLPFKKIPSYFGKTKENGSFKITNIKPGTYKVVALKDVNSNYRYDSPDESIGFIDTLFHINANAAIQMSIFKEAARKQYIKRSWTPEFGHLQLVFNRPTKEAKVKVVDNPSALQLWTTHHDTVDIWLPNYSSDSIKAVVEENHKVLDTLHLEMPDKKSKLRRFRFSLLSNNASSAFDLNSALVLVYNHPLAAINADLIQVKNYNTTIPFAAKISNEKANRAEINAAWIEDSTYTLTCKKGALTDIYGLPSDSVQLKLHLHQLNYYGTLQLKVQLPHAGPALIQFVDEKDNVMREKRIARDSTLYFDFLPPMTYRIKYIADTDNNGEYTTGDYLQHRQAEQVIYYPGPLKLRSNWDLEQAWQIAVPVTSTVPPQLSAPVLPAPPAR